ncbi:hypothetical protein BS50DRAFT_628664 [Corynespora cassiicola Philippines]|uniref:Uncharacterized protein n=1 Tax=Corynespora cassiicola Philippines TaxID=1448308 RepID=A0A2T2PCU7_CORCC|nr:hypothetical protein BS50DRAFT_628664 [Corynespora cassiicola Philippines]
MFTTYQKSHMIFQKEGNGIFCKMGIDERGSRWLWSRTLSTIHGAALRISAKGPTRSGTMIIIYNLGMPFRDTGTGWIKFGSLRTKLYVEGAHEESEHLFEQKPGEIEIVLE